MQYFILPNNIYIARNLRVASMAIAQAVMQTYYPQFCKKLSTPLDYWEICPTMETPSGQVLLLLRDPVDRFLSAASMLELDTDSALANASGPDPNEHFIPQTEFIAMATQIFNYPAEMEDFCTAAGLPYPLPLVNESVIPKAILDNKQLDKVQQIYANDTAAITANSGVKNGTV